MEESKSCSYSSLTCFCAIGNFLIYSISFAFTLPSCPGLFVTFASFSAPSTFTRIIAPWVEMFALAYNLLASFVFTAIISLLCTLPLLSVTFACFTSSALVFVVLPSPLLVSTLSFLTVVSVLVIAASPPFQANFLVIAFTVFLFPPLGFLSSL